MFNVIGLRILKLWTGFRTVLLEMAMALHYWLFQFICGRKHVVIVLVAVSGGFMDCFHVDGQFQLPILIQRNAHFIKLACNFDKLN